MCFSHEQTQLLHLGDHSVPTVSRARESFENCCSLKNPSKGRQGSCIPARLWLPHPLMSPILETSTCKITLLISGCGICMHGAPSTGEVSSAFGTGALAVCSRWAQLFIKDSGFAETACLLQPENPMNSASKKFVCPASKLPTETLQITPADAFPAATPLREISLLN